MRGLMMLIGAMSVAAGLTACGSAEKKPSEPVAVEREAPTTKAAPTDANHPMRRALVQQRQALAILRAHKDSPIEAAQALDAYHQANFESVEALKAELGAMAKAMVADPDMAVAVMNEFGAEIQELVGLAVKLQEEAPALFESPEVQAAMTKLAPQDPDPGDEGEAGDE